ncbi:MAG: DNA polymerase III subunit alpha [Gammaproteobacteria bacterium]|nr:DNA polymerase III subunit alpha [Gammaproteobacteria bacterium]
MKAFAHLSVHTEYSIVDSVVRIDQLAERCKARKIFAVALTDLTNLFACWLFQHKLRAKGVKPIFGTDVRILDGSENKDRLLLLAKDQDGLRNLYKLMTIAYTKYEIHGCITMQQLTALADGLIALSGGTHGKIGRLIANSDTEGATQAAIELSQMFSDRFYLELTRTGWEQEEAYITHAVDLAQELRIPLVATNDVRFVDQSDYSAHETRFCVAHKQRIGNGEHEKFYSDQQYLRSPKEMSELFNDLPDALENAIEIAKRCTVEIPSGRYLPQFRTERQGAPEELIDEIAHERLNAVFEADDSANKQISDREVYVNRLQKELEVIKQMGFAGYFLIVGDIVSWAKQQEIPVGPGRGSGAASLVAYTLGIVDIDPIKYELMFERLLNPERVSLPDFDIDFCMNRRNEVIEYVTDLYGRASVAQIVSFNTFGSKVAVKDAARALGKPRGLAEKIANLIPIRGVQPIPIAEAIAEVSELGTMVQTDPDVETIVQRGMEVEGLVRNRGKHAGGVVIAPDDLDRYVPIYTETSESESVTQLDKKDVEELGLVKFDFLGLKTMTVIAMAMESINAERKRRKQEPLSPMALPMDDPKVFESLHEGETTGIFQLESIGMRQKVKDLNPTDLEDLIALLALFRPGPLDTGVTDRYIRRKNKLEDVKYLHPIHEKVLSKTFGLMVYQEDVMNLARELAGFSMGEADKLRSAMGKKNEAEMLELQPKFIEGCVQNGVRDNVALEIYEDMRKFARYAFNRAHTVGYAIVAYQTAYLKHYYPAEFLAALASCESERDTIKFFMDEAKRLDVRVGQPSVNESEWDFVGREDKITVGFAAVRGIAQEEAQRIVEARSTGSFTSLFDLCERADFHRRNRNLLVSLIHAGALDCIEAQKPIAIKRAEFLAQVDTATHAVEQKAERERQKLGDLFGASDDAENTLPVPDVEPISLRKLLFDEGKTLGFYVSGHPIEEYRPELQKLCSHQNLTTIDRVSPDQTRTVAGMVKEARVGETRSGNKVTRIQVEDEHGNRELSLFAENAMTKDLPKAGEIVVAYFSVKVERKTKDKRVQTTKIATISKIRNENQATVEIDMQDQNGRSDSVRVLRNTLRAWRANECSVRVNCAIDGGLTQLELGSEWNVCASPELMDELKNQFGSDSVRVAYYDDL